MREIGQGMIGESVMLRRSDGFREWAWPSGTVIDLRMFEQASAESWFPGSPTGHPDRLGPIMIGWIIPPLAWRGGPGH